MENASKLKTVLEDILNEKVDVSNRDADLEKDYDMDSMDAVEIADRVEREFNIEIATKSIYEMKTIGDLLDKIEELQKSK